MTDDAMRQEAVAAGKDRIDEHVSFDREVSEAVSTGITTAVAHYANARDQAARAGLSDFDRGRLAGIREKQQKFGECDCGHDEFLLDVVDAALDANAALRALALDLSGYVPSSDTEMQKRLDDALEKP